MSEKKGWGKTVLGWFVVQDGSAPSDAASGGELPADAADALIAKYAHEAPPPPPVELKGPLPPLVGGNVDFVPVYEAAGIDAAERDRVTKAHELLRTLPPETPVPVKRQIVETSLRMFGVPTEQIIEAGVQEMEALESFIRQGQAETQKLLTDATARITELEREIAGVRDLMQKAVSEQETRTHAANREKLTVQAVLEFFGQEAVAKVIAQSEKVHTPA